ncbi:MAG: flagellar protein FliT [Methylococcaceae bacterium]
MSAHSSTVKTTQAITETLEGYLAELDRCIVDEQWDQLTEVLDKRQQYFEALFTDIDSLDKDWLNAMIKQVLLQDNALATRVIQQKDRVEHERLNLSRSRQAVKAYQ